MLALGLFYFLLLLLIILIIYMILLFDDYTSRTLVPPLLNSYYGTNSDGQAQVGGGYYKLYLTDGVSVHESDIGVSGSLDFGASGASKNPIEFMPNYEDRTRPINGVFKLLLASREADGQGVCFRITDYDEEIVKDASYYIESHTKGAQEIIIPFSSKDFRDQSHTGKNHNFEFYGASVGGTSILNNTLLVNSMYVTYY